MTFQTSCFFVASVWSRCVVPRRSAVVTRSVKSVWKDFETRRCRLVTMMTCDWRRVVAVSAQLHDSAVQFATSPAHCHLAVSVDFQMIRLLRSCAVLLSDVRERRHRAATTADLRGCVISVVVDGQLSAVVEHERAQHTWCVSSAPNISVHRALVYIDELTYVQRSTQLVCHSPHQSIIYHLGYVYSKFTRSRAGDFYVVVVLIVIRVMSKCSTKLNYQYAALTSCWYFTASIKYPQRNIKLLNQIINCRRNL